MAEKVQYILLLFIISCGVKDSEEEFAVLISDTQFNFHQNTNQLFVSTKVQPDLDGRILDCLLYTSPSPRDGLLSRMPSSA